MAVVRVVRSFARQQPHGPDMSTKARQNLNRRKDRLFPFLSRKLQVKQSVRRRLNLREDLHIGGAAGPGIGHDIETAQQRLAVGAHRHQTAAFPGASVRLRAIDRLGKMQPQFVDAFFERNRVAKLSLPAGAVEIGILRPPDLLHGAPDDCTALKPGIGAPQFAGMVDKAAS